MTAIRREAEHARAGRPAHIIAKVNSLVDPSVIEELYLASQAGVQIDLIVRGMCSLRPGVAGISDRIRVVSLIDRYLEHARIFYFDNNGKPIYLLASADWMQRNFDHRVEIAFPVLDEQHQAKLKEILVVQLADNFKGWQVRHDGTSVRLRAEGVPQLRSQERLYEVMGQEPARRADLAGFAVADLLKLTKYGADDALV
jgi:polyphosphate kinase